MNKIIEIWNEICRSLAVNDEEKQLDIIKLEDIRKKAVSI